MFALDQRSRTFCVGLALTCFVTAITTTPREARSAVAQRFFVPPIGREPAPFSVRLLPVRRDPFAGAPHFDGLERPPSVAPQPRGIGLLPPPSMLRAAHVALPAEHVSAIVTGLHPYALVSDDSTSRMVSLGDTYAGVHITAIALDGLHLADGRIMPIAIAPENTQP